MNGRTQYELNFFFFFFTKRNFAQNGKEPNFYDLLVKFFKGITEGPQSCCVKRFFVLQQIPLDELTEFFVDIFFCFVLFCESIMTIYTDICLHFVVLGTNIYIKKHLFVNQFNKKRTQRSKIK